MAKFLQRLHKEVLDKFPFSISGYTYPDKEYEGFFHRVCKFQESLEGDNKIHFTISGFAKLKTIENLSEANLDIWETESLKYLLFNDNYLGYSEPVLSLYVALLQRLSPDKRIVNILAENVNNSILIKVLLNEKLGGIRLSFIKSDNTLLIEVPVVFFKYIRSGKKDGLQDLFKNIDYEKDLIVKKAGQLSSYSIDLKNRNSVRKFNAILDELLDIKTVETVADLTPENVHDRLLREVLKNDKYAAKEIYSLIFASAILCFFYECSITYFVSTARVANNKRYTLGAMGIGLKAGHELSDNEKALYSILVNHLAANLSTQLIYESNKHLKREANKLLLANSLKGIKELDQKGEDERQKKEFSDILHGLVPVSGEFDSLIKQAIKENPLLTDEFLNYYESLKDRNDNRISKYCLVTLIEICKECNIRDRCHTVLKVEDMDCCQASQQVDLINLPLLDSIVKILRNKADIISCSFFENEIVFTIQKSKRPFDVVKLRNQLLGMVEYGNLLIHLSKNFEAIDCHGVLSIHGMTKEDGYVEVFHSRKTIQDIHNNKFVLNEDYPFPADEKFMCFQLKFQNEL